MIAGLLAAAGTGIMNNLMSEWHADKAQQRQKELMSVQNQYNQASQVSAPINQVQGLRMAGFNPAVMTSQGVASPVTVSGAGAPHAENVEVDPATLLLKAQAENLEADTAKKRAEVGNVNQDTDLKFVQKLYTGANTDKVKQEAQNIRNINNTYGDMNRALAEYGRGMAEKWQSSEWYNKLGSQTKDTIDALASGSMPLTAGGLTALRDVIASQKELSDADRSLVSNAFDNAVTEAMFNDHTIVDAIAREPKVRQAKLRAEVAKLNAELPEVRAKVVNLLDDLKTKKLTREQLRAEVESFMRNDLGYLKAKGEYGKWFEGYAEQMLMHLLPLAAGGAAARGVGAAKTVEKVTQSQTTPPIYDAHGGIASPSKTYTRTDGVQSFHW